MIYLNSDVHIRRRVQNIERFSVFSIGNISYTVAYKKRTKKFIIVDSFGNSMVIIFSGNVYRIISKNDNFLEIKMLVNYINMKKINIKNIKPKTERFAYLLFFSYLNNDILL